MTKPILIVISTYNRLDLTAITLDSVKRCKSSLSDVLILDDASTEYDAEWLKRWGFKVISFLDHVGVGKMACERFHALLASVCPFILTLDNDLVVAPGFDLFSLEVFLALQRDDLTVFSPYRSVTQEVIGYEVHETCCRVKTINGCSQFTDRDTVERILTAMSGQWEHPWDANISRVLTKMVVPKRSLIQHLGVHGTGVNGVSKDVAVDFVGTPL